MADLSGEALGWAVGKAEGLDVYLEPPGYNGVPWRVFARYQGEAIEHTKRYNPWEDWALGGPLADRHCKVVGFNKHIREDGEWRAFAYKSAPLLMRLAGGESLLVAICRAIVLLHRGETVQVPRELCQ
ncbi:MAG: DUF2591 domain-containing protein [Pseudomonas sp.]|uniref:DUF2591 domain-containing protein n=1 Tax=Pseudomonas sp. TaxID=306 RepID=UPI001D947D66|nr:DUF2591 domain-containing protein [Pseudomonas sp.]MPS98252.1 DUF2591 domain-containing protein [Pseudomonas sp.]